MNVRERFETEVCMECTAFKNCDKDIHKQSQCATLATYFIVKKFTEERM